LQHIKLELLSWNEKNTVEVNGVSSTIWLHSSKHIFLCSAEERNPYRFGITWVSK